MDQLVCGGGCAGKGWGLGGLATCVLGVYTGYIPGMQNTLVYTGIYPAPWPAYRVYCHLYGDGGGGGGGYKGALG